MTQRPVGVLRLPSAVLFGAGRLADIGRAVAQLGSSALICTDSRLSGSAALGAMTDSLEAAGVSTAVFAETAPELPDESVYACLATITTEPDVVIGFGGGSCIDMAKVVSLLLTHGGPVSRYYGEFQVPGPVKPVVAVPTTSGTGSEATPVAVVADHERAVKIGISSPHLIPALAICDPDLTSSCPSSLITASAADAVSHLVESFTAIRREQLGNWMAERVFVGSSLFTDQVALMGLGLMRRSLANVYAGKDDAGARGDVMIAALAGGISLGAAGTAAAHALQYPVGALTGTPHGLGVGVLLRYVMRFNLPACIGPFTEIGRSLGVVTAEEPPTRSTAEIGVRAVDALLDVIQVPVSLSEIGVSSEHIQQIATGGLDARRLVDNNPRSLDQKSMLRIVRAAVAGDLALEVLAD